MDEQEWIDENLEEVAGLAVSRPSDQKLLLYMAMQAQVAIVALQRVSPSLSAAEAEHIFYEATVEKTELAGENVPAIIEVALWAAASITLDGEIVV